MSLTDPLDPESPHLEAQILRYLETHEPIPDPSGWDYFASLGEREFWARAQAVAEKRRNGSRRVKRGRK